MTTINTSSEGNSSGRDFRPILSHTVPFAAWIIVMAALSYIGEPSAWKYALRTALCLVLLLFLRPWRYYSAPRWRDIPWGIGGGILALGIWLLPEISWSSNGPFLQEMYLRFGIMPLGRLPAATETSIYDPRIAGWFMALTRLAGSAFVIAIIEEFFWRGFLYRWLIERRFTRLSPATWDVEAFLIMVLLFGLEHNRWLAGMAAGAVYGALMIYTRSIWSACFAHIVTNLLLGIYVLNAGAYVFW